MPRELIPVTRSTSRLVGATRIEPGYPKDYTAEQMRMWADDLDRLNKTPCADLERWQTMTPEQLSPEQRRMLAVHDKYFTQFDRGIKGSLPEDGTIELDGGRHRAGYLLERGVDPIPVWVSAPDRHQLDDLRARCERERPSVRPDDATQPRVALAEQHRAPDRERTASADAGCDRVR